MKTLLVILLTFLSCNAVAGEGRAWFKLFTQSTSDPNIINKSTCDPNIINKVWFNPITGSYSTSDPNIINKGSYGNPGHSTSDPNIINK